MNMTVFRLIGRRFASALLTLLLVSMLIFAITNWLPGDAAQASLGQAATPDAVAALRAKWGLDEAVPVRFAQWIGGIAHGNLGKSFAGDTPVWSLLAGRLPNSLLLTVITTVIAVPLAVALGVASAIHQNSRFDRLLSCVTISVVAIPEFLVATVAVLIFAVQLHWLPAISTGADSHTLRGMLSAYAMPVFTLCCVIIAQMARMTRAAVINQLDAPYVEMARLKGLSDVRIVLRHVAPNAIAPVFNVIVLNIAYLFGGAIVVEIIFNYPGLASLTVNAVSNRDMPVLQACVMFFSGSYLLLLLLADVCTILSNPKLLHAQR